MSHNLRQCMQDFLLIKKYPKSKRDAILSHLAHKECIWKALREISHNIIKKNIKLTKAQKIKLNRYAKTIKGISKGTKNKKRRRRLIQQSGGFIGWLAPVVAAVLPSIIDALK